MKEFEITEKREPRIKHFLREDGSFIAKIYPDTVHYQDGSQYKEIDNRLQEENGLYHTTRNNYHLWFPKRVETYLFKVETRECYMEFYLENANSSTIQYYEGKWKNKSKVVYSNVLNNVDIEYKILPNKLKESIILKNNMNQNLNFIIKTNLELKQEQNKIQAYKEDKFIFEIEKSFMRDNNDKESNNIMYQLSKQDDQYLLHLVLDEDWLNDTGREFPVIVDPTIMEGTSRQGLYDTYIFPGDDTIDRSHEDILKAGVQKYNNQDLPNRTLIKFDLPEIGTGSEIIGAYLDVISYPSKNQQTNKKLATVHRVTKDWSEDTATWNTMADFYDSKVESIIYASRSVIKGIEIIPERSMYDGNITELVKSWYSGVPNYGVMIKSPEEVYIDDDYPAYFSKDNTFEENSPLPVVSIVYRNQSGIENYLNYQTQNFECGSSYVNTWNGNLTSIWNIGSTMVGKMPIDASLIYNTNDVIVGKESKFGIGWMLNFEQSIKEVSIDSTNYLEFLDEDGTTHYFYQISDNTYQDEDGLGMTAQKEENSYKVIDKTGNTLLFEGTGTEYYLTKLIDVSENEAIITRDDNKRIIEIKDANNEVITFVYNENQIIITSPDGQTTITKNENKIASISTSNGVTTFSYNSHNLIETIEDTTGIQIKYECYDTTPYKVKKVTQYGISGTVGNYFTLEYGNQTTKLTNHKNQVQTLIFNNQGNLLSVENINFSENLQESYALTYNYGTNDETKNKLLQEAIPVKYIKNYLKNTSFEASEDYFSTSPNIQKSFSNEYSYSGNQSLKLISTENEQYVELDTNVSKGKYYTFSAYVKGEGQTKIQLQYKNSEGETVIATEEVAESEDFIREDVTIHYPSDASSALKVKIMLPFATTVYLDDIQLEEGEVANYYNILENSDFSEGLTDWTLNAWRFDSTNDMNPNDLIEVVTIDGENHKALKVKMNPLYGTNFSKTFPIKGKAGDLYNISFWYKNEGIPGDGNTVANSVLIYFKPVGKDAEYCILPSDELNSSKGVWQYFTFRYGAIEDYEQIRLMFNQGREANDFYITNLTFFKDLANHEYEYDEKGNVSEIKDSTKTGTNTYKHDTNNSLIKMTTPRGSNFTFEYDNTVTDRVLSSISGTGITNEIKYDEFGNPVVTKISKKTVIDLQDGCYRIRAKGTKKYIKREGKKIVLKEDTCSNTLWKIHKQDDIVYLKPYLSDRDFLIYMDQVLQLSPYQEHNQFAFEKNDNNTYYIHSMEELENESGEVNGIYRYLKENGDKLEAATLVRNDPAFEFYLEESTSKEFIESNASYTDDGKYLTSVTDSLFHKTEYETNPTTGLITKIKDANGNEVNYTYDNHKRVSSITQGDKTLNYTYNTNNQLSSISQGNKTYNFIYDDFLNTKSVNINNQITLIINDYEENNENIKKTTYGNGDVISFDYDEFNRKKKLQLENDTYYYKYDNVGNLSKILSDNHIEKYRYDLSGRIQETRYDQFCAQFQYDSNDNVINKKYLLDGTSNSIQNTFDADDNLTKTQLDNDTEIDYMYDGLGRRNMTKLNNHYDIQYEYVKNGNRTSTLIKSIQYGSNQYSYQYDAINNIKKVFYNGNLLKEYFYDNLNELISEDDYEQGKKISYNYDNFGNLLTKTIVNKETNDIISTDSYEYENPKWQDQLTKFNNQEIIYDEIGNPIKIGTDINLSWQNGCSLSSYSDKNKTVNYQYNHSGVRIGKTINDTTISYYLEDDDVLYEKRGNDLIYYLYDDSSVVGLKYKGNTYYYIKNIQNDIIGILDSNYQTIASYTYDSFGKVLSVQDENGNEITDETHIANINPFRYRGYYYDTETRLYYLKNRYYNPEWCRFLNVDSIIDSDNDIMSNNLYLYAKNNPIMYRDSDGTFALGLLLGKIATAVVQAVVVIATAVIAKEATKALTKAAVNVSSQVRTKEKTKTKKETPKDNDSNDHNVYFLRVKPTGKVEYVGRTQDITATTYRHKHNDYRKELEIDVVARKVSAETARGLEEYYLLQCGTLNKNKQFPMNNQIHGVSAKNPNYMIYWNSALTWASENIVKCVDPSRIR